jgi:hypothetical protein
MPSRSNTIPTPNGENQSMQNASEHRQPEETQSETTEPESLTQGVAAQNAATPNDAALNEVEAAEESSTDNETVAYDQGWLSSFMRPALIVILATCLNIALLTFLRRFVPSLAPPVYQTLIALGIVAALVGCITSTWLAQPSQRARRTAGYRMAEFALLILLTRIVLWILTGDIPTLGALFTTPLASLFDGLFIIAAIIVTISWVVATEMSRDLLDMALRPDEIKAAKSGTLYRETVQPGYTDRQTLLNSFATRWVIGGIVLVILATGTNVGFSGRGFVAIANQNVAPAVIIAVVVYFLVGLMLLSHGQLAILRARWALEQTPSRDTILRYWPAYAMVLLLVIGGLAALMPFGGTYWLATAITFIIGAVYFVVFGLMQLIGVLFALVMSLLPFRESAEVAPPPPMPSLAPPPAADAASSEFLEIAGSTVFWLIALLIVGYAAYVYFTDKGFHFTWLKWLWQMLTGRWRQATSAYQSWQRDRIHTQDGDRERGRDGRRRWFSWGKRKLEPDAQIRHYYLSLLKEAESKGIERQQAETPFSYAPRLLASLSSDSETPTSETSTAVDELTGAFIQVRYTDEKFDVGKLPLMERFWQHLRQALRL